MRIASFFVCARCLLVPAALGGMVHSLLSENPRIALYVLALIPLTLCVVLLEILVSTRTNCPLCMTPVLGDKSCNKHAKVRRLFGSYKLRVALGVIFRSSFRCPYCNEPTMLKVRGKP
jgi:hypothetical protein